MKNFIFLSCLILSLQLSAQVGIGNTDPKAALDVSASNVSSPMNNDGILIPRMSNFPATDPTVDQDGMLIFYTGTTRSGKGFYYWDQSSPDWIYLGGAKKIDELSDGKSDNDGTDDGSSIFLGVNAGGNDDSSNNANVGIGKMALTSNSTGFLNVAIGFQSMLFNTTGSNNTALGYQSLMDNTTGTFNTALGTYALYNNTTARYNSAIGHSALFTNSTGEFNTAIGTNSLNNNSTGDSNVAVGYRTLFSSSSGNYNNALGNFALTSNTTGFHNVAIGLYTLSDNTTGYYNIALGNNALTNNITGFGNIAIGNNSGNDNVSGNNNVFLGYQSGFYETGSNKLYIENSDANATNALIYGEFDNDIVRINGNLQVNDPSTSGYNFPTLDGGSGEVLTTNGAGQLLFTDPSFIFTDTDDQQIDVFNLSGTTLQLSLEDDGVATQTVDLSSLQSNDHDWYEIGTSNAPDAITDNMYTQGEIAIGTTTQNTSYNVTSSSNAGGVELLLGGQGATIPAVDITANGAGNDGIEIDLTATSNATSRTAIDAYIQPLGLNSKLAFINSSPANEVNGLKNNVTLSGNIYSYKGLFNSISGTSGSSSIPHHGIYNYVTADIDGQFRGIENRVLGGGAGNKTGMYNFFGNSAGPYVIGHHTEVSGSNAANYVAGVLVEIPSTVTATNQYGIYSDVTNTSAYSGYFLGRVSIGTTTTNNYILPSTRGPSGYILQSGGGTSTSWVDPSTVFSLSADNGLTETSGNIQLGGSLIQSTTVSQGIYDLAFDLTGIGDFRVYDNGSYAFVVEDTGDVGFGLGNPGYQVHIHETDNTKSRAMYVYKEDNSSSDMYGIYNNKISTGSSTDYGQINVLQGSGTGEQYGLYNDMQTTGTGNKNGVYNFFATNSPSSKYGINNEFLSSSGPYYGVNNNMSGSSSSAHFGIYNSMSGSGTGAKTGIRNEFSGANGNSNPYQGVHNAFNDSGNGVRQGVYNNLTGDGTGTQYALWNNLDGTGGGNKYGTYTVISNAAGGTHYGTYSNVNAANGWAGYFLGKNYVSDAIGINVANPDGRLDILHNSTSSTSPHIMVTAANANTGSRITFDNDVETTNNWVLYARADDTAGAGVFNIFSSEGGNIVRVESDGKVGIMRNPTTNALEVGGDASKATAGSWLGNSDKRLKKNINTIESETALQKLLQLRGVSYEWNDHKTGIERPKGVQYGFIAQELMQVFPEKVTKDNLGYYQTAYGDYDAIFVQAIKELNTKVENLETENQELKAQLSKYERLEARLSAIEKNLSNTSSNVELADVTKN